MNQQVPPATPEIGKTIKTGSFNTNYHDVGEGAEVLLIHGSGPGVTSWANWRLTIPSLSKRGRVIAPDMVGFGYTESPANVRYEMATWIDQVTSLLDHLGIERISVIGNSFGGSVALALSKAYPDRVSKVLLMGPVGVSFPITPGLEKVWGYQPSAAAMKQLLEVFVYDQRMATDDLAEMRYRASIRADVQERFASLFPAPRQRWVEALAQTADSLRQIKHETLVVHGRDDKVIPFSASEELVTLMPNARLLPFDRCGHWVQIEHTERFNEVAAFFLFGNAARSARDGSRQLADRVQ